MGSAISISGKGGTTPISGKGGTTLISSKGGTTPISAIGDTAITAGGNEPHKQLRIIVILEVNL